MVSRTQRTKAEMEVHRLAEKLKKEREAVDEKREAVAKEAFLLATIFTPVKMHARLFAGLKVSSNRQIANMLIPHGF